MPEYEDDQSNDSESAHSLSSELCGFDVPIMRTQKAIVTTNKKLCRSTREKNPDSLFGDNDYMAYYYTFMMKVADVHEPKRFTETSKDPRWVEAMNKEMQAL